MKKWQWALAKVFLPWAYYRWRYDEEMANTFHPEFGSYWGPDGGGSKRLELERRDTLRELLGRVNRKQVQWLFDYHLKRSGVGSHHCRTLLGLLTLLGKAESEVGFVAPKQPQARILRTSEGLKAQLRADFPEES